jgi:hypothetical protein
MILTLMKRDEAQMTTMDVRVRMLLIRRRAVGGDMVEETRGAVSSPIKADIKEG